MIGLWVQGPLAVEWARRARCAVADEVWVLQETDSTLCASGRAAGHTHIKAWSRDGRLLWGSTLKGGLGSGGARSVVREAWAERAKEGRAP